MPLPPPPPPCPAPSSSCPPVQKRPQHSRLTIWQHVSLLGSRSPSRSCRGSLFRKAPAAALCAGATGKGRAAEGSSQEAAGCGGCRRLCAGARGEHARKLFRVACVPRTSPVPPSRALPLLRGACAIWEKSSRQKAHAPRLQVVAPTVCTCAHLPRGVFPLPRPFSLRQVSLFCNFPPAGVTCVSLYPLRSGELNPSALPPHLRKICSGRGHPLVVSS